MLDRVRDGDGEMAVRIRWLFGRRRRVTGFGWGRFLRRIYSAGLPASFVQNREQGGSGAGEFRGAAHEAAGKFRKQQGSINFTRQIDQSFGTAAGLLREVQIGRGLEAERGH